MKSDEQRAWTTIVEPGEYDLHMANVGQAQANAKIISDFLQSNSVKRPSLIAVFGAGTGQFMDWVDPVMLKQFHWIFTDISHRFLSELARRANRSGLMEFQLILADIEALELPQLPEVTITVLVLEHVDWQKAVVQITACTARTAMIVIQENPVGMLTNVTPGREIPRSLIEGSKYANSHLIDAEALTNAMRTHGFELASNNSENVLDGKRMRALVFSRIVRD